MQQQQQQRRPTHNFALDDEIYFAIKQLSSLRGKGHPARLVSEILKDYVEEHKELLIK
jgi:spore maturation protein CgeB